MRRHGTIGKNSSIVASKTKEVSIHTFRRALDPEAVRVLIAVYMVQGQDFVEISYFFTKYMPGVTTGRGGLFPRLRWWGLVEVQRDKDGEEIQGVWRVTDLGVEFIKGLVKMRRYVDEQQAEVVREPYGESYGVARFAGWLYDYEKAGAEIRRLAAAGENVMNYFSTQWQKEPRSGAGGQ